MSFCDTVECCISCCYDADLLFDSFQYNYCVKGCIDHHNCENLKQSDKDFNWKDSCQLGISFKHFEYLPDSLQGNAENKFCCKAVEEDEVHVGKLIFPEECGTLERRIKPEVKESGPKVGRKHVDNDLGTKYFYEREIYDGRNLQSTGTDSPTGGDQPGKQKQVVDDGIDLDKIYIIAGSIGAFILIILALFYLFTMKKRRRENGGRIIGRGRRSKKKMQTISGRQKLDFSQDALENGTLRTKTTTTRKRNKAKKTRQQKLKKRKTNDSAQSSIMTESSFVDNEEDTVGKHDPFAKLRSMAEEQKKQSQNYDDHDRKKIDVNSYKNYEENGDDANAGYYYQYAPTEFEHYVMQNSLHHSFPKLARRSDTFKSGKFDDVNLFNDTERDNDADEVIKVIEESESNSNDFENEIQKLELPDSKMTPVKVAPIKANTDDDNLSVATDELEEQTYEEYRKTLTEAEEVAIAETVEASEQVSRSSKKFDSGTLKKERAEPRWSYMRKVVSKKDRPKSIFQPSGAFLKRKQSERESEIENEIDTDVEVDDIL